MAFDEKKFPFVAHQRNIIILFSILLIVGMSFMMIAVTSQLLGARITTTSFGAAEMKLNQKNRVVSELTNNTFVQNKNYYNADSDSVNNTSCSAEIVRYTGENPIGRCFTGASYTCRGGQYNGRTFSAGPSRCRTSEDWILETHRLCGCGDPADDILFGNCRYKAMDFVSSGFGSTRISCTRSGISGACHYEAKVTCNDGQEHDLYHHACLEKRKQSGGDWEFYANLICCKNIASNDTGAKPLACREFSFEEYGICNAYCKQRGFVCESGGSIDLKCNDNRCRS